MAQPMMRCPAPTQLDAPVPGDELALLRAQLAELNHANERLQNRLAELEEENSWLRRRAGSTRRR